MTEWIIIGYTSYGVRWIAYRQWWVVVSRRNDTDTVHTAYRDRANAERAARMLANP